MLALGFYRKRNEKKKKKPHGKEFTNKASQNLSLYNSAFRRRLISKTFKLKLTCNPHLVNHYLQLH